MSSITSNSISLAVTPDQIEAMAQRQIKKHHVAIVLLHWFNAAVWLFELATGAAIIVSPSLRFMPAWYLTMMQDAFGNRANLLRSHIAVGMTWIVVLLVYAVFGWRNYLHAEVLRKEIALDQDDLRWLMVRTRKLVRNDETPLPPQGAYNAGQKLYALMVYVMLPIIMITGIIMMAHLGTVFVQWAMVVHFVAVGMVVSGLMVHVYMGAVFPEERPAFYSMITGMVNELYAYRHHFKWWAEVKQQQQAWQAELQAASEVTKGGEVGKASEEL